MSYSSREVIKKLEKNGYIKVGQHGSHAFYKDLKTGKKIPVPHPKKDLPKGTYYNILKQAGLK